MCVTFRCFLYLTREILLNATFWGNGCETQLAGLELPPAFRGRCRGQQRPRAHSTTGGGLGSGELAPRGRLALTALAPAVPRSGARSWPPGQTPRTLLSKIAASPGAPRGTDVSGGPVVGAMMTEMAAFSRLPQGPSLSLSVTSELCGRERSSHAAENQMPPPVIALLTLGSLPGFPTRVFKREGLGFHGAHPTLGASGLGAAC